MLREGLGYFAVAIVSVWAGVEAQHHVGVPSNVAVPSGRHVTFEDIGGDFTGAGTAQVLICAPSIQIFMNENLSWHILYLRHGPKVC